MKSTHSIWFYPSLLFIVLLAVIRTGNDNNRNYQYIKNDILKNDSLKKELQYKDRLIENYMRDKDWDVVCASFDEK